MDAKSLTCSGLFLLSRYLFQGMLSAAYIHVIFRFPINNGYVIGLHMPKLFVIFRSWSECSWSCGKIVRV